MKRFLTLNLAALAIIAAPLPAFAQDAAAVAKAQAAATAWLPSMDSGDYARSWDMAASVFQAQSSKMVWESTAKTARSPFGTVKSRQLLSAKAAGTVPGVPAGQYVLVQYRTDFANKSNAIETVIPVLDKDGSWKVAGYQVQ